MAILHRASFSASFFSNGIWSLGASGSHFENGDSISSFFLVLFVMVIGGQ